MRILDFYIPRYKDEMISEILKIYPNDKTKLKKKKMNVLTQILISIRTKQGYVIKQ